MPDYLQIMPDYFLIIIRRLFFWKCRAVPSSLYQSYRHILLASIIPKEPDTPYYHISPPSHKYQWNGKQGECKEGQSIRKRCLPTLLRSMIAVAIPPYITRIEYGSFRDCTSLRTIVIPNSVTEIGYNVFDGWSALEKIDLPKYYPCHWRVLPTTCLL